MRKTTPLLLGALLLLAGPATAKVCTVDAVPAATLLLPYFEVDLANQWGITTLFSINNASATAVLTHVVVWSDLSVPVLDFNVYLTGYDVQTLNMHDILINGVLPATASLGQDPNDTISHKGLLSQDVNFASCQGQLPPPLLPASFINHLQTSLTGQPSPILGGLCAGTGHGDQIARGYVTVDTVSNCTLRFPGDAGYFAAGGTGDATDQNVLWGDYIYIKDMVKVAEAATLVHVEADPADPATTVPGRYTFYGRYVGWTAVDNREPLATNFAVRYLNGGPFSGGTDLLVWRDSKVAQGAFICPGQPRGGLPPWYPLGVEALVVFDEQENPTVPVTLPVSPQPPQASLVPFAAEAQRVSVGSQALPVQKPFGWLFLDLNSV
ncbi:MAG: hypothetical protein M3O15_09020, partial [Acidobacteriota bacterium]|nr:hypothetical protein [Acidobacteriota bacterium]